MVRGLYTAGSGMMLQMAKQDALSNNIANVNSAGYKKSVTVSKAFPEMLIARIGEEEKTNYATYLPKRPEIIGVLGTGAALGGVYTDYDVGHFKKTDVTTDFAIGHEAGFFVVETPQGEAFTRDGQFKLTPDLMLTDNNGFPVLDIYDDYIYMEHDDIAVDSNGIISTDGDELTQFKIVQFEDNNELDKIGSNLFTTAVAYEELENPGLVQGFIEESNVNAVQEMVNLINVVRNYEALQKVINAEDELMGVAIDKVASTM